MSGVESGEPAQGVADFNLLRECRHGRMLFNINDKYIGRSLDLYGEFSEPEIALLSKYLRPGDTVVEVGATWAHTRCRWPKRSVRMGRSWRSSRSG